MNYGISPLAYTLMYNFAIRTSEIYASRALISNCIELLEQGKRLLCM